MRAELHLSSNIKGRVDFCRREAAHAPNAMEREKWLALAADYFGIVERIEPSPAKVWLLVTRGQFII
jgi:hypothetical protein